MRYHLLGRSGMRVSSLCLGTMTFGRETSREVAQEMLAAAHDAGVNCLDTADIYGDGLSEEIVGEIVGEGLVGQRDAWIVATKACQPFGAKGPNDRGASRRHLQRQCEASLRRLRTDWIDLFYVHLYDPDTCLEETMSVLDDLVRAGKVMAYGVSNFSAWQTMKAQGIAARMGLRPLQAIQPMYSLLKRQAEVELLPMAASEDIAVLPYSPLGAGLLSGKFNLPSAPTEARLSQNAMYQRRYQPGHYKEIAAAFVALAREVGAHPVSLAIAWVGAHPAVTAPIIGARNMEQLAPCLDAARLLDDGFVTDELYQAIAALSPTPPPATDRLETQKALLP